MSTSVSIQKFSQLSLPAAQLTNLHDLGYHEMTPIQMNTLPAILSGRDLVGQAKTGSGKTAAFGIGLLEKINVAQFTTQSLVICPTRELADQVSKELRRLARYIPNVKISSLCGGQAIAGQVASLVQHPPHIAVGTPGRLLDHLKRQTLSLKHTKVLVLDEADRMLDMGFADEMDEIIDYVPTSRQTLLFSATYPTNIKAISQRIQRKPLMVMIEETESEAPKIDQLIVKVDKGQRVETIAQLLYHYDPESCVVFCNTIRACQELEAHLSSCSIDTASLHGDLEQRDRDQILLSFSNHSCRVLVATDVAARGLDIKDLAMVINFDLPFDPEVYVHRIGRTGRAGKEGMAVSLCTAQEEHRALEIEEYLGHPLKHQSSQDFVGITPVALTAPMVTLCIDGGRKAKIRPGDILGALTADGGIQGTDVGKIDIFPMQSYVAVARQSADRALNQIRNKQIKGLTCRVRLLSDRESNFDTPYRHHNQKSKSRRHHRHE